VPRQQKFSHFDAQFFRVRLSRGNTGEIPSIFVGSFLKIARVAVLVAARGRRPSG
jgi:hypothetical protein